LTVDENIRIDRYQYPLSFAGNDDSDNLRASVWEKNRNSKP